MSESTTPVTADARLRRALMCGVLPIAWIATGGLAVAVFLWLQLEQPGAAWHFFKRAVLIAITAGLVSGISRWILIGKFGIERQMTARDWSSQGFLIGLLVVGYITTSRNVATIDAEPGEVIEIAGPTLTGENFQLEQYRGRVVLVDFWATWCGPCVGELPHVKSAYREFHDRGFEIVGVSFDESRQDLESFVADQKIEWPQIIFDAPDKLGFNNPNGVRYGVDGIPETLLVDSQGRLIERGLRGRQLKQAVRRALNIPPSWTDSLFTLPFTMIDWMLAACTMARWYVLMPICIALGLVGTATQMMFVTRPLPETAEPV